MKFSHRSRSNLEDFDREADDLLDALGQERTERTSEEIVAALHRTLLESRQAQVRRRDADERLEKRRRERDRLAKTLDEFDRQVTELQASCGEADEVSLVARFDRAKRHAEISARRDELGLSLTHRLGSGDRRKDDEARMKDADPSDLEVELDLVAERFAEAQGERDHLQQERGKHGAALERLGDDAAATARAEYQGLRDELEHEVERFVERRLCRDLLAKVTESFAREHRPALLERASGLVNSMTAGKYRSIELPFGAAGVVLVDAEGDQKSTGALSTGTREQLFLALRLAYVLEYASKAEAPPIVMDDVLVNFDAARARATLRALGECADSTQILFLTCHQHLIDAVKEELPESLVLEVANSAP